MITCTDISALPAPPPGGSVVSIGVFDGVHLGHQAILKANRARAQELGAESTVVTFGGHPKALLLGRAPRTLTSLAHRLELFRRAGVARAVVLDFDPAVRDRSAEAFTREMLIDGLGARAFVLGFDSKFGRDRRGTPELLRSMGLDVQVVAKVEVGGRAVSSTAIREAVELGDLASAQRMLGRAVSVLGTVVRGAGLGRQLGFPTANLDLHHELHPPCGVWAGCARLLGDPSNRPVRPAVANIGWRPTVSGLGQEAGERTPQLEVHLLDDAGDLYGREMEFQFAARLRAEKRFADVEELRAAIAGDVARARQILEGGAGPANGDDR